MPAFGADMASLMGEWAINTYSITLAGASTPEELVPANAMRWSVIISLGAVNATGTNAVALKVTPPASANDGITLNQFNPIFRATFRDDGALVQQSWYGSPTVAGLVVHITEAVFIR